MRRVLEHLPLHGGRDVARYAERVHHPDRLTQPLHRTGPKGSGDFAPIGWDEALDIVADRFLAAERRHGAESVWPYFYAGTMGLVQRDGMDQHPGFGMTARELIDATLQASGWGRLAALEEARFIDAQPDFNTAHCVDGFPWPDGRFRLKPDWAALSYPAPSQFGPVAAMPSFPDHWPVIEAADEEHPFRLVTAPARHFLNSSFTETPGSQARERRPTLMIHPDDAAGQGLAEGDRVELTNRRGAVILRVRLFDGVRRGVVIAESIWPNAAHPGGRGINTLTGADPVAPFGGAAVHDSHVRLRRCPD